MYGDPHRRPRPPMDPYGRGGYGGGYGMGGGMGEMCGDCNGAGGYMLPGIVVLSLFVGLVLLITGFAAPNWLQGKNTDIHLGLWRSCPVTGSCTNLAGNDANKDWFTATQALTTISLVFLLLAAILLIYWLCSYSRYFFVKALIIALLFMTFIFMIVAIGVFGGNYDDTYGTLMKLDWCFYLVCISCVMVLVAGVFLLCIESHGSFPSFGGNNYRDRFGFGYGEGRGEYGPRGPPGGGMGMGGFRGPPPPPNPYGGHGGPSYGPSPYGSGTLPFTSRY